MKENKKTINIVGADGWYSKESLTRGPGSERFDVVYNKPDNNELTYFINDAMEEFDKTESDVKVALITDCRCIVPWFYDWIDKNHHNFDYVVTYDDISINSLGPKAWITPAGGTFIWPKENWQIFEKTKLCSYVCSTKNWTPLQKNRVNLLNHFYSRRIVSGRPKFVPDLFGTGHNPLPDVVGKIEAMRDYAFSITIENHVSDHYFSEKIIDCFLTGVVPIYMGAKKISEYFDPDGIIFFKGREDLLNIVDNLTMSDYKKRMNAIKNNFQIAKNNFIDSIEFSFRRYYDK